MEQFLMVAGAHFLALLSPGPDFFLIVRAAVSGGWRRASGICLGVALANGVFIALALAGSSLLRPGSAGFALLQWGGCLYLGWMGWQLLRAPARPAPWPAAPATAAVHTGLATWGAGLRMGLASGLLNPKNALFYTSLFALLGDAGAGPRAAYGLWMFTAVLAWDLAVAAAAGHPSAMARAARHLPRLERTTGAVLLLLAAGVALAAAARL